MSIENPTLAHFRHFSSLFTNLPAYKAADIYVPIRHYICREPSTNQLLFMQNKPNFQKSQMNLNPYNTTNYENISDWTLGENKPNSNPIKPNFKPDDGFSAYHKRDCHLQACGRILVQSGIDSLKYVSRQTAKQ